MALAWVIAPESASAATSNQQVTRDVDLDEPGTATIDAFDTDLGTLTKVSITIEVEVLVQGCVENNQAEVGATTSGTVSGSLAVTIPTGANSTVASAVATLPAGDLTATNGTDDCADGFSDAGIFVDPVDAPDAAFADQTDAATRTATLTAADDLEPFIGTGTVTISHTPDSDTEFAVPDEWDALSVAVGFYEVDVTYTYTPSSTQPGAIPRTGAAIAGIAVIAAILLLLGVAAVAIGRRHRANSPEPPAGN